MPHKQKHDEKSTPFDAYLASLSQDGQKKVAEYLRSIKAHIMLPPQERDKLVADFQNALLYYAQHGVSLADGMERLSVQNLGGFYARPPVLWYPLDDAAKIYPLSMKHGQMAVFRLSVYLKKPVVPELLQMALVFTIKRFPSFATTVKKGFFWHYLDSAKKRFAIEPDSGLPCRPMKIASSGSQAFRVMYYTNRISAEFFHILTDGTGGMTFIKTLTAEYLRLLGTVCAPSDGVLDINEAPAMEETVNAFSRAVKNGAGAGFMDKPAVQMSGKLTGAKLFRVLHFKMDATALKNAANQNNATITAYVLAQMFLAGHYATDELRGEMSIQVPVNMRKFYPSCTLRNFSMYCGIRLPIETVTTVQEILPEISRQLTEKSAKDCMSLMMTSTENMVRALRYIPLFIKAPAARIVYGFLGDKIFSNTLSNIGLVKLPPEISAQIDSMDVVLGTALTNRASCALVSFGNTSTLSVATLTADPSFEERLYDLLCADGISVTVEGSTQNEN